MKTIIAERRAAESDLLIALGQLAIRRERTAPAVPVHALAKKVRQALIRLQQFRRAV